MCKLVSKVCSWFADRIAHARLFVLGVVVHWVVANDRDDACEDEACEDEATDDRR